MIHNATPWKIFAYCCAAAVLLHEVQDETLTILAWLVMR